jgi:hypothetical protein
MEEQNVYCFCPFVLNTRRWLNSTMFAYRHNNIFYCLVLFYVKDKAFPLQAYGVQRVLGGKAPRFLDIGT